MKKAPVVKDPQQQRAYNWEGGWADWNSHTLSLTRLREYVHWACALYGLKPPAVKAHKGNAYSWSQGNVVSFQYSQMNRAIALHETSHYICDQVFGLEIEGHSPEWLAVYLWLLIEAGVAPRVALCASAKAKGLRWVPLWQVSPKRLAGLAQQYHTKKGLKPPKR